MKVDFNKFFDEIKERAPDIVLGEATFCKEGTFVNVANHSLGFYKEVLLDPDIDKFLENYKQALIIHIKNKIEYSEMLIRNFTKLLKDLEGNDDN